MKKTTTLLLKKVAASVTLLYLGVASWLGFSKEGKLYAPKPIIPNPNQYSRRNFTLNSLSKPFRGLTHRLGLKKNISVRQQRTAPDKAVTDTSDLSQEELLELYDVKKSRRDPCPSR